MSGTPTTPQGPLLRLWHSRRTLRLLLPDTESPRSVRPRRPLQSRFLSSRDGAECEAEESRKSTRSRRLTRFINIDFQFKVSQRQFAFSSDTDYEQIPTLWTSYSAKGLRVSCHVPTDLSVGRFLWVVSVLRLLIFRVQ